MGRLAESSIVVRPDDTRPKAVVGGGGEHMAQYGGVMTPSMSFYRSRFAAMGYGRALVRRVLMLRQMISGLLAARRER